LLIFAFAMVFKHMEQNYVVGIRGLWTLQRAHMWEDTHFVVSVAFAATNDAGIVLVFFVP
jgi:hypothetical protein